MSRPPAARPRSERSAPACGFHIGQPRTHSCLPSRIIPVTHHSCHFCPTRAFARTARSPHPPSPLPSSFFLSRPASFTRNSGYALLCAHRLQAVSGFSGDPPSLPSLARSPAFTHTLTARTMPLTPPPEGEECAAHPFTLSLTSQLSPQLPRSLLAPKRERCDRRRRSELMGGGRENDAHDGPAAPGGCQPR